MPRNYIDSLAIRSVGYAWWSRELEIEFQSGGIYQYSGVPLGLYWDLMAASSHGNFYCENIRGKYPCTRVA